MNEPLRVGLIGYGYWGPNLLRNFASCPDTRAVAVADLDPDRLARATSAYPGIEGTTDAEALIGRDDLDAVAVATPVGTHFALARAALASGKHVWVEKPMTASSEDARVLVELAESRGLTLHVDHTYLYTGAARKMKELIDARELGDLLFIDSVRINLGLFQHDVNVIWDLAPHDLALADYLLSGRPPVSIAAVGASHLTDRQEDIAYVNVDYGNGLIANFHLNWLSPVKVRHIIVGGRKKSIVFNDLDPFEKVRVYEKGAYVDKPDDVEARRGVLVSYRTGDMIAPKLDSTEALAWGVREFAEAIRAGANTLSDGRAGLRLVQLLEAAERSVKDQGGRIAFRPEDFK